MFCIGYGIIRASGAPECTMFCIGYEICNIFSPYSAVSCVADMLVSNLELYILCDISLHFI